MGAPVKEKFCWDARLRCQSLHMQRTLTCATPAARVSHPLSAVYHQPFFGTDSWSLCLACRASVEPFADRHMTKFNGFKLNARVRRTVDIYNLEPTHSICANIQQNACIESPIPPRSLLLRPLLPATRPCRLAFKARWIKHHQHHLHKYAAYDPPLHLIR